MTYQQKLAYNCEVDEKSLFAAITDASHYASGIWLPANFQVWPNIVLLEGFVLFTKNKPLWQTAN